MELQGTCISPFDLWPCCLLLPWSSEGTVFITLWWSVTLQLVSAYLIPFDLLSYALWPRVQCPCCLVLYYRIMHLLKITSDQVPSPSLLPSGCHSISTSNSLEPFLWKNQLCFTLGPSLKIYLRNLGEERNLQKSITLSVWGLTFSDLQREALDGKQFAQFSETDSSI